MENRYKIMGEYNGNREEVDSAETLDAAIFLLGEYSSSFGPSWDISIFDSVERVEVEF